MHREYADRDIVQDTEIYYFDSNTYDANYDFKIEIYFIHLATLQDHKNNLLHYGLIKIKECDLNKIHYIPYLVG